jgi:peptide/nickel transport system permease protein
MAHRLPAICCGGHSGDARDGSLDVGNLVLTLAALSFLGLGAPSPAPELGAMVPRGLPYLLEQWWVPIMPGLAVLLLALVANLAGDGLRDLMGDR